MPQVPISLFSLPHHIMSSSSGNPFHTPSPSPARDHDDSRLSDYSVHSTDAASDWDENGTSLTIIFVPFYPSSIQPLSTPLLSSTVSGSTATRNFTIQRIFITISVMITSVARVQTICASHASGRTVVLLAQSATTSPVTFEAGLLILVSASFTYFPSAYPS